MDDDDALLQLLDAASVPEKRARPSSTIKSLAGKRSGAAASTPSVRRQVQAQPCKHYVEVLTGIKCKLPKVSGVVFKEQVSQLQFVPLDKARSYTSDAPWLTIGVLVRKEYAATSNGQSFSRWQLADLRGGELRAVLFGDAHAQHKGAAEGSVVALGSCRTSRDAQYTSLSVSAPHQVQLLATSEGFGFCQGITKAGERCCRAVDKTASPYCEYHVLQQQRQVKRDLRGATASGAVAAASSGTDVRGGAAGGPASGGSGGGGGGGGIEGPGRPLGRTQGLQPLGVPAAAALTGQERREREAAQLMANRERVAQQIKAMGGLKAPDLNRTRPLSPPRHAVSGGSSSSSSSSAPRAAGGGGAAAGRAGAAAVGRGTAAVGAGRGGGVGATKVGGDSKRAKLLSGLGLAPRPASGPVPQAAKAGGASTATGSGSRGGGGGAAAAARGAGAAPKPAAAGGQLSGAAAQFRAAFGSVLDSAPADAAPSDSLKALADAQRQADVDKLLAHYEKKDAVAQQLEGITKLTVTAFRCSACNVTSEKRHPSCSSHHVVRVQATKRWWSCRSCGWRLTTLNTLIPTKRCPKCRDPAAEFSAASMFVAPREDRANDAGMHAGVAAREAFMARGVEHDFALSSFH